PLLPLTHIPPAAQIPKQNQLISVLHNTFITPYYQNPLHFPIHILLHSPTKYIPGHTHVLPALLPTSNHQLRQPLPF
ncbi:PLP-dependent transferase, partial [Staphylococcus hominis]|uniref:PLP-dependent transferase n=1 Tax=Staphylococcus hominis TaxID=1290 RepID=UPI001643F957